MADGLARLWTKFLPEIEQRLTLLESAASALADGALADDQRNGAHQAAHKLAGTLGTFGLHRGTEVARQAEVLLANEVEADQAPTLREWAEELRLIVRSRQ
jgi:HPt (histidine-containing phosphotransfer) domain-containing protein